MATVNEKVSFYLAPDKAERLRRIALEQRRTLTAILDFAVDQIIAEHESNGTAASPVRAKRSRPKTQGA